MYACTCRACRHGCRRVRVHMAHEPSYVSAECSCRSNPASYHNRPYTPHHNKHQAPHAERDLGVLLLFVQIQALVIDLRQRRQLQRRARVGESGLFVSHPTRGNNTMGAARGGVCVCRCKGSYRGGRERACPTRNVADHTMDPYGHVWTR